MSESKTTSKGISTFSLLGVVFIVLKLTDVIDWNWWWVLAPFWGGLGIGLAIFTLILLFALIAKLFGR
jgi:phosphoglycerol transferase MdoB-like AlkP superfamily enzyme